MRASGRPVFLTLDHPLIQWIHAQWIPDGLTFRYEPAGITPVPHPILFPWNQFTLRGIDLPIASSDFFNHSILSLALTAKVLKIIPPENQTEVLKALLETDTLTNQYVLSLTCLYQGRLEEALTYIASAIAQHPKNPAGYRLAGTIYLTAKQPDTANAMWRYAKFLESLPTHAER